MYEFTAFLMKVYICLTLEQPYQWICSRPNKDILNRNFCNKKNKCVPHRNSDKIKLNVIKPVLCDFSGIQKKSGILHNTEIQAFSLRFIKRELFEKKKSILKRRNDFEQVHQKKISVLDYEE